MTWPIKHQWHRQIQKQKSQRAIIDKRQISVNWEEKPYHWLWSSKAKPTFSGCGQWLPLFPVALPLWRSRADKRNFCLTRKKTLYIFGSETFLKKGSVKTWEAWRGWSWWKCSRLQSHRRCSGLRSTEYKYDLPDGGDDYQQSTISSAIFWRPPNWWSW